MNIFQTNFYYISQEKKTNIFEEKIEDLNNRLNLYFTQFKLTSESYVEQWKSEEKNLIKSTEEKRAKAEDLYNTIIESLKGEEYASQIAMNQSDLDGIDYHFWEEQEKINEKYKDFLDFYAKSIVTTLYSLNESKLNDLCQISRDKFNIKEPYDPLKSREYLKSSFDYLENEVKISKDSLNPFYNKIKDIQILRNKIVHYDSKSLDKNLKEVVNKNKDCLSINEETGYLRITKAKFINQTFILFQEFYEELIWFIEEKQDYEILKNGLKYWFGLLDRKNEIKILSYSRGKKNNRLIHFKLRLEINGVSELSGILSFAKNNSDFTKIIDKTKNSEIELFLENQKAASNKLHEIFAVFNTNNEKRVIEITLT